MFGKKNSQTQAAAIAQEIKDKVKAGKNKNGKVDKLAEARKKVGSNSFLNGSSQKSKNAFTSTTQSKSGAFTSSSQGNSAFGGGTKGKFK